MTLRALDAAADHSAAFAGGALLLPLDLQTAYAAVDSRPEVDLDLIFEIRARLGTAGSPATAEHAAEDIAEAAAEALVLWSRRTPAALEAGEVEAAKVERNALLLPSTACSPPTDQ